MKKVLNLLIGFPIGVMMLLVSYMVVHYIDGTTEYLQEISRYANVKILANQFLCAGTYYLFAIMFLKQAQNLAGKGKDAKRKDVKKFAITLLATAIVGTLVDKYGSFAGEEVVDFLISTPIIIFIIACIVYLANTSLSIRKINKKIEKRNKN